MLVFLLGLLSLDAGAVSEKALLAAPQNISALVKKGRLKVADIPNPHWRQDACQACHTGKPAKKTPRLRVSDANRACNQCHGVMGSHVNIHPVAVRPSKKILKTMSAAFRQTLKQGNGRLNCLSCHDATRQCDPKASDRKINPDFLRGAPYRSRTGLCYQCHNRKAYQRLNPHDQINDEGKLLEDKCMMCHPRLPRELKDGTAVDTEIHVRKDASSLCLNCHVWTPHPGGEFAFADRGGPMHLVVPPPRIARFMKKSEEKNGLILPLAEDGKVYCATCHNPHEKGVIVNLRAARGADEPKRLRSPNMCFNCHDL